MRISQIELNNFGSYEDKCIFNFATTEDGKRIIIVGGKNGAGKTILFTAVQLCLYGNYAFGYKSSGKFYLKEVYDLINNRAILNDNKIAYVKVSFLHTEARDQNQYEIARQWSWATGTIIEDQRVWKNGQELDEESVANFQNYLLHLIPPDMLRLYFFDGEKIADYFLSEQHINIREALMILSGNDTFDMLYDNVKRVMNNNKSEGSEIADEYLKLSEEKATAESSTAMLKNEFAALQEQLNSLEAEHEHLISQYALRGGLTLDQWKVLQSQLKDEEEKREHINWQRKSIATDILPFIITKELVEDVLPQIKNEEEFFSHKVLSKKLASSEVNSAWRNILSDLGKQSDTEINEVISNLSSVLITGDWDNFTPLLQLSDDEKMQVHTVLSRVFEYDSSMIKKYQKRLDKSLDESKRIRTILQNSDIEHIEEYAHATAEMEASIKLLKERLFTQSSKIQAAEQLLLKNEQLLSNSRKSFENELKRNSVSAVSGRVTLLLEDMQKAVYSQLVKKVEQDLKTKFRQLIRKADFFDDIIVDLNFDVHIIRNQTILAADIKRTMKNGGIVGLTKKLGSIAVNSLMEQFDSEGNDKLIQKLNEDAHNEYILPIEVDKDRMSSGEKQIFVMALYWALMQQSNNDLPFIIDTPFARIDTEHRANITKHFFMALAGQLIVLSTNEELNGAHLQSMNEQIAHVYTLEYGEDKRTRILCERYFEV